VPPRLQRRRQLHAARRQTGRAGPQACHELVPPEALALALRQLVDAFVHDRTLP
jgi:hypothetical protein